MAKWERRWNREDNQEVGLEAAILEGKRNSSLVERFRAENVTGLKPRTEAAGPRDPHPAGGSGAFPRPVKPDREVRWRYGKRECRHE